MFVLFSKSIEIEGNSIYKSLLPTMLAKNNLESDLYFKKDIVSEYLHHLDTTLVKVRYHFHTESDMLLFKLRYPEYLEN